MPIDKEDIQRLTDFFNQNQDSWRDLSNVDLCHSDRYQNPSFLNSGGMKEIYEVYDTKMRRKLALAQLKKESPLWHCESFLNEAYLTASLSHPNIISIYDVGLKGDCSPYFVMELKKGQSLDEIVKRSWDVNELLQIFIKVCDAVSYAHSQGILHLDIKPDNIQVGQHGEVKLCDWGLASRLGEQEGIDPFIMGTPGFMSPEQISKGKLGFHTDIYSLGVLLYFIITRSIPFDGGLRTKIDNTLSGKIDLPIHKELGFEISSSLYAVARRAMAVKPEDRYESVEVLKSEVSNFLTGYSTEAENAGLVKELKLFLKRNRQSCTVASVLALILFATIAVFIQNLNDSKMEIALNLSKLEKTHKNLLKTQRKEKENYSKFIAQKEEKERTSSELKDKKLNEAYSSVLYPIYFANPVEAIDKSLQILNEYKADEGGSYLEEQIIINLFLSQRFNELENYSASSYTEPLFELAQKYRDIPKSKRGLLDFDNMLRLLKDINLLSSEHRLLKQSVFERFIYYYKAKRKVAFVHWKIIKELLISMNSDWDQEYFVYEKENRKLILHGKGLREICGKNSYHSQKCIFTLMGLEALILRKTEISSPHQFKGLNLNKLDVRNTPINTLSPNSVFRGIRHIHAKKGQFPEDELETAPDHIEFTFND